MRFLKRLLILLVLSAAVGLLVFAIRVPLLTRAGSWVMQEDRVQKSDAIFLLGGSFARGVLQVADLYRDGTAPVILLVQERYPDGFSELLRRGAKVENSLQFNTRVLTELGVPRKAIIVMPGIAESTRQEAEILSRYAAENPKLTSVVVVGRKPQLRRTRELMAKALPANVKVHVVGSKEDGITADNWWKDTWYLREVSEEFLKNVYNVFAVVLPIPTR